MTSTLSKRPAKEHLYEVDFMRAFIILGVLCVHVISFFDLFTTAGSSMKTGFDVALVALHFTREAFMFITGLVLFIVYYHKPFTAKDFWLKRFKLIMIPYLVWTLVYMFFSGTYLPNFSWQPWHLISTYLIGITTGNQFYLYYLVISMQLYLIFPIFIPLMRKLEKYHVWIFIASFILEIALMWLNQHVFETMNLNTVPASIRWLIYYRDRNILTYQFWFVSGAILAAHYQKIKNFFLQKKWLIYGGVLLMLAVLWSHQALQRGVYHESESFLVLVLQPIMIPFSFMVSLTLWRLGISWSNRRFERSMQWFSSFIKVAAAASFGVFLIHPIILHYMEVIVYALHTTPTERLILLPFAILSVYGVSILLSRMIAHIPYVSYIVGQKKESSGFLFNWLRLSQTR